MARPRSIDLKTRYGAEIMFWEASVARLINGQPVAVLNFDTRTEAINARHRLNMCRAFIRDDVAPDPKSKEVNAHAWDSYTVKLEGNKVYICMKPGFAWDRITVDGQPHHTFFDEALDALEAAERRESRARQGIVATPKIGPDPDKAIGGLETE